MATKRMTVEDLWKLERPAQPTLSPDGAQACVSVTAFDMEQNKGVSSLWLLSAFGGEPRRLTTAGDKDAEPRWSPDGRWIAFVAKRAGASGEKADEEPQVYVIAPDGGEARRVTSIADRGLRHQVVPGLAPSRVRLVGMARGTHARRARQAPRARGRTTRSRRTWSSTPPTGGGTTGFPTDACRISSWWTSRPVPPATSSPARATSCRATTRRCITTTSRPTAARSRSRSIRPRQALRPREPHRGAGARGPALPHAHRALTAQPRKPRLFSPDGTRIAFLAQDQRKSPIAAHKLAFIDRKHGGLEVVRTRWDRSIHAPLAWGGDGTGVFFHAEDNARAHLFRWTVGEKAPRIVAEGGTLTDFDVAGEAFVFVRSTMSTPPAVFRGGPGEAERRIDRFNADVLAGVKMGAVREFEIPGWNREKVHLWVIYPPDFDPKKKWPLLHNIHGGPHSTWGDNFHFRWNNQLFAAQGYVVVCVNYHGSTSFGQKFIESIDGEWGKRELADVEAGTDFMLRQGYIDRDRLVGLGRQLRRLHGRVDERPHGPLQGLRVPRRMLRLGRHVRRRRVVLASQGAGRVLLGQPEARRRAEPARPGASA